MAIKINLSHIYLHRPAAAFLLPCWGLGAGAEQLGRLGPFWLFWPQKKGQKLMGFNGI